MVYNTEMPNINLPKNISIPNGHKFDFLLSAFGVQIYECFVNNHNIPNNWTLGINFIALIVFIAYFLKLIITLCFSNAQ
jgi:hypothetical protein